MNTLVFVLSFVICGLIQGLFSFGGGIIIMPILSSFFDLKNVIIPVFSLYNIFSNIYSYLNYRSINIFKYKKLLFYGFLGNIIGSTIIMVLFSTDSLKIILAIATIINIVFSSKIPKFSFDQHQFLAGFSSGVLGGAISLGNMGLVILYGKNEKNDLKSLVSSFCLFQNFITLIIYIIYKRYNLQILLISLIAIFFGFISQKIGTKISNKLTNSFFSKLLNAFLLIISIYLLFSAL